MKAGCALLAMLTATGCATQLPYTPGTMDSASAQAIIEQVLMEQPEKFRPQSVEFTPQYLATYGGYATVSRGSAAVWQPSNVPIVTSRSNTIGKELSTRIYYSSLGEIALYHKNNYYRIRPLNTDGRVLQTVFTSNEEKAHQFMDALNTLRAAAATSPDRN